MLAVVSVFCSSCWNYHPRTLNNYVCKKVNIEMGTETDSAHPFLEGCSPKTYLAGLMKMHHTHTKDLRTFLRTLLLCVVTSLGWDRGIFGICTFHIIPFILFILTIFYLYLVLSSNKMSLLHGFLDMIT